MHHLAVVQRLLGQQGVAGLAAFGLRSEPGSVARTSTWPLSMSASASGLQTGSGKPPRAHDLAVGGGQGGVIAFIGGLLPWIFATDSSSAGSAVRAPLSACCALRLSSPAWR